MIVLTAKVLYTPLEKIDRPVVLIEDGRVQEVGSRTELELPGNCKVHDFGDGILGPGLVDMHIHGSAGYDVMRTDESGFAKIESFLAGRGVTSYFPTTVTAPLDTILSSLDRMAGQIESAKPGIGRTQPLGIHLEGPFLSHIRRGVHTATELLTPTIKAFDKFWQASRGRIRVMTIAPELDGAEEVIAEATKRGVCISIGHSDAKLDEARKGIAAGARHATHTFNAMRPLDHRDPGILEEVLTNKKVKTDVIADGIHVHPTVIQLLLRAKGVDGVVLITDATAAAGMPDGKYQLGALDVEVKNGMVCHQGTLAGSALTLDRAVQNIMKFENWSLQQALQAATLNPSTSVDEKDRGRIQAGSAADFAVFNDRGEVKATVIGGVLV